MKKLFLVIGLSLPLLAQQTETDKEITKQEQREREFDVVASVCFGIPARSCRGGLTELSGQHIAKTW